MSDKLKSRLYQHEHDCRESSWHKIKKTALAEHYFSTGYEFDFNKVWDCIRCIRFRAKLFKKEKLIYIYKYLYQTVAS